MVATCGVRVALVPPGNSRPCASYISAHHKAISRAFCGVSARTPRVRGFRRPCTGGLLAYRTNGWTGTGSRVATGKHCPDANRTRAPPYSPCQTGLPGDWYFHGKVTTINRCLLTAHNEPCMAEYTRHRDGSSTSPYDMRHIFASLLFMAGKNPLHVSKQMGHHSPAFTYNIYGHLMESLTRRQVEWIDEIVFPEGFQAALTLHFGKSDFAARVTERNQVHGWGRRIRTPANGSRARRPTARRSPSETASPIIPRAERDPTASAFQHVCAVAWILLGDGLAREASRVLELREHALLAEHLDQLE